MFNLRLGHAMCLFLLEQRCISPFVSLGHWASDQTEGHEAHYFTDKATAVHAQVRIPLTRICVPNTIV